jgi:hypothetical protein
MIYNWTTNYWKAHMHKRICLAQQKEKLQLGTKQIQELDLQE